MYFVGSRYGGMLYLCLGIARWSHRLPLPILGGFHVNGCQTEWQQVDVFLRHLHTKHVDLCIQPARDRGSVDACNEQHSSQSRRARVHKIKRDNHRSWHGRQTIFRIPLLRALALWTTILTRYLFSIILILLHTSHTDQTLIDNFRAMCLHFMFTFIQVIQFHVLVPLITWCLPVSGWLLWSSLPYTPETLQLL